MRDRRVRVAFVGLILAFPMLMVLANPRATTARQAALPLFLIESVLAVGLTTAARERPRLLAGRQALPAQALRTPSATPRATTRHAPVGRG